MCYHGHTAKHISQIEYSLFTAKYIAKIKLNKIELKSNFKEQLRGAQKATRPKGTCVSLWSREHSKCDRRREAT